MKRIKLSERIESILLKPEYRDTVCDELIHDIVKFISNNYRRRKYNKIKTWTKGPKIFSISLAESDPLCQQLNLKKKLTNTK